MKASADLHNQINVNHMLLQQCTPSLQWFSYKDNINTLYVCVIYPYLNPHNNNTQCQCQRFPAHKWLLGGKSTHGVWSIFDSLTASITSIFYAKVKSGNGLDQACILMHFSTGFHQLCLLGSCVINWTLMHINNILTRLISVFECR